MSRFAPVAERLYGNVKVTDKGCWEFLGCRERHGYGRLYYKYTTMMAHRVSWFIGHETIPSDLFVLHKCDNPPCVNPNHLFIGTADDNTQDMMSKGRHIPIRNSTLTLSQALFIKISLAANWHSRKELKNFLSVSYGAIDAIKHKRNWRELNMTELYNLRSSDNEWIITKFDDNLNVLSSYTVSEAACDCPAGHRPSCRHRIMLPTMLAQGIEDSPGFYDFDKNVFLEPISNDCAEGVPTSSNLPPLAEPTFDQIALDESGTISQSAWDSLKPHGVTENATAFDAVDLGSTPSEAANSAGPHPQLAMNVEHPSIGHIKRRI